MVIKVGLNGFGRVGRVVFRTCLQNPDLEISAINDPAIDADYICYLIKFDSTHGKLTASVSYTENTVAINGKTIQLFHEKLPPNIPWKIVGVQYVIEASGMFTSYERASGHLKSDTVRRVIVTAPSTDIPMIILGVNHTKLGIDQKVLSCGSSTLYCLAPIIKVLEDSFGVEDGFITSIHAMTPSLKPLDGLCLRGKHWRDHRSIHQNIIPASTGACKALGRIIPSVRDKMTGLAFRVPIVNVSVLDISLRLVKPTSIQEIMLSVRMASRGSLRNILKISTDEAVSSDFNRDSHSCIVDGELSLGLNPNSYKIICWYENEYSYACRVLDSIFFSEKQLSEGAFLFTLACTTATSPMKLDPLQQTKNLKKSEKSPDEAFVADARNITVENVTVEPTRSHQSKSIRSLLIRATSPTNTAINKHSKPPKLRKDETGLSLFHRRQFPSFFQHFNNKTTKEIVQSDCAKAQERLEKVKVEFCKMVNITEDLLKKSCRQTNEPKVSPVACHHKDQKAKQDDAAKSNSNETHSNLAINSLTDKVDVIKGANKLSISTTTSTVDSCTLSNDEHRCSVLNYCNDFTFGTQLHKSPSNKNITTAGVSKINSDKTHRVQKLDAIVESSNVNNFHEHNSTDTVGSINEYLSDKSQLRSLAGNENYIRAALSKAKNYKNEKEFSPVAKKPDSVPPITVNQTPADNSFKFCIKEISKTSLNFFKNKSSLHAIEKELKKRNIVLISEEACKTQLKENEFMIKEHGNHTVYCCEGFSYPYGEYNKFYQSSTHENNNNVNSMCGILRTKFELGNKNNTSEGELNNNVCDNNIKTDEGYNDKVGNNKPMKTSFEIIDQKDSDYETDNFSVQTDMQKEKNMKDFASRSYILSETANANQKKANETVSSTDHCNTNFESYNNFESRTGDNSNNSNRGSPETFLSDDVNCTDKKSYGENKNNINVDIMSLDCGSYCKAYPMTRAEDMSRAKPTLRADESVPSVYSGTSNPPTSPDSARHKQDIFDKLDSVSASNSDCSSYIDGKKSQVINITDLTKSLEDLERLDKICRIVEISDQLSDKLFSRLDSGDSHNQLKTIRKWSFKDLCEKINLDEFCNRVFGRVEI